MISREKLASALGVTPATLRGWQDRHWQRGVHYVVIGKTTMIDAKAVRKWLKSQMESSAVERASESESTGKVKSTRKLIRGQGTLPTSGERLSAGSGY